MIRRALAQADDARTHSEGMKTMERRRPL